jgi:hypothetical protein
MLIYGLYSQFPCVEYFYFTVHFLHTEVTLAVLFEPLEKPEQHQKNVNMCTMVSLTLYSKNLQCGY